MISVIKEFNQIIWGLPMIFLLLGTHLFFTFRLHFVQKKVFIGIKKSIQPPTNGTGELSGFATLATTLAATLGTGNIIGISTAIALGGAGAIFWCWITGILGMATTYAECYLCILYRHKNKDNTYDGGPMYLLSNGLKQKKLAKFYAFCTLIASFGVGCTTQSNAISSTASSLWKWNPVYVGFLVAIPTGLVIIGGVKSVAKVCTKLVPAMGLAYILCCFFLLFLNRHYILSSLEVIILNAFSPKAISGGVLGGTLLISARYGIARGLFTNEAGLGTAGIAAANAITDSPKNQALISMTATFWDTVIMCAITGLVIITNLLKFPDSIKGYTIGEYTTAAFTQLPYGTILLGISLILFALATLIGWSFFGEKATNYLIGQKGVKYYHLCYTVMIYVGSVMSLDLVWELTDLINAFMSLPCILAILLLNRHINT